MIAIPAKLADVMENSRFVRHNKPHLRMQAILRQQVWYLPYVWGAERLADIPRERLCPDPLAKDFKRKQSMSDIDYIENLFPEMKETIGESGRLQRVVQISSFLGNDNEVLFCICINNNYDLHTSDQHRRFMVDGQLMIDTQPRQDLLLARQPLSLL